MNRVKMLGVARYPPGNKSFIITLYALPGHTPILENVCPDRVFLE